jgi:Tol biopolymer transport system component
MKSTQVATTLVFASVSAAVSAMDWVQPATNGAHSPPVVTAVDTERGYLKDPVQLTIREQFAKAGESYFSPDGKWIIFQATEAPKPGNEVGQFYAMYVGKIVWTDGRPTGLEKLERISPDGSANTCGWFHPTELGRVIFGSTLTAPKEEAASGYQRGTSRYRWAFPDEMDIVTGSVRGMLLEHGVSAATIEPLAESVPVFSRERYDAECSFDPTGRFILYSHMEPSKEGQKPDANIYVYDTRTQRHTALVAEPGYDGGPFFSPDGKSICYRSDRAGNDLLQIYVADLKFESDASGVQVPVGITREYQLTDNEQVNWAPYWHPSGKFLVYASSEAGHNNYEIFAIEVDREKMKGAGAEVSVKVPNLPRHRITTAAGADLLPAFSADGKWMMWTSQRGPMIAGEAKPSSQLWIAEWTGPSKWPR